jgi:uncharacterized protein (DUF362 family)
MEHLITRRDFLKTSGLALSAGGLTDRLLAADLPSSPDLVAVEGMNYYDSTTKAVEALGGIGKFVSPGARVGLLVNSVFDKPGTFVKPQIALAVVAMCYEAGAKEIISLEGVEPSYWRRATMSKEHAEMVRSIRGAGNEVSTGVDGTRITTMKVTYDFLQCDVYFNLPVYKDHEGTKFTGSLKNIMGATRGSTNQSWHRTGGLFGGYYDDIPHLSECIAEGNLVRSPNLIIGDATEVIVTNGPSGPGRLITPRTVVAGTDPVATDAFGATLLGLDPRKILMIRRASELGVGSLEPGRMLRLKG